MIHQTAQATTRYMEFISAMCQDQPAYVVAKKYGHSATTVCAWDKMILESRLPPPKLDGIRVLLIDEKAVGKGHDYVTVVQDGDTRELLFLEEGKKKETLQGFLDNLNNQQTATIEAVGIDRGGAYLSAVHDSLPKAAVVFDKFHIIQNMNKVLDEIRREEYRIALKKKSPTAELIKSQRFNLYRLPENQTDSQDIRLKELLASNENLSMAHLLSEQLRFIWDYSHIGYAERYLQNWVSLAEESNLEPLIKFAKGLWRDRKNILSYAK
jgi:transposase